MRWHEKNIIIIVFKNKKNLCSWLDVQSKRVYNMGHFFFFIIEPLDRWDVRLIVDFSKWWRVIADIVFVATRCLRVTRSVEIYIFIIVYDAQKINQSE